ncbi:MAG TPA: cation:dicarboxylase symporter family transporter [Acidobacteriaceae bacterium]|jgi:proton glutamate symport protein|nr:cation:dicarboxylase symporter family transporter [Acidobacteriaceae bacterium]
MTAGTATAKARKADVRGWVAAGVALYLAAALAQHFSPGSHAVAMVCRLAAIALLAWAAARRRSLTGWIFWAMLAGIELGLDAPHAAIASRVFSDIFLRLIRVIVAPLILGTLITGIAGHASARTVGRLGIKSLIYFEVLTTAALMIGLAAIDLSKAGVGLNLSAAHTANAAAAVVPATPQVALSWQQFLVHVFPENIASAVAENQILQVVVFAILFGLALGRLSETKRAPLLRLAESLTETMFAFTNIVMLAAPVGVGAALAYTVASSGLGVMVNLGKLLLTLYVALLLFALLAMLPVLLLARLPLIPFLRAIAEPATIAFATSTSEAALPRAMEEMEAFGVPRGIVAFVIPTGYSFNLAGSALYLSLAAVFTAQAAGIQMSVGRQAVMLLTLMLTSKGVAGVPRAGLVLLLATASMFGLPIEPVMIILGIDALMDMGRTVVNVVGNCLASAVVARWEGSFRSEAQSAEAVTVLEN